MGNGCFLPRVQPLRFSLKTHTCCVSSEALGWVCLCGAGLQKKKKDAFPAQQLSGQGGMKARPTRGLGPPAGTLLGPRTEARPLPFCAVRLSRGRGAVLPHSWCRWPEGASWVEVSPAGDKSAHQPPLDSRVSGPGAVGPCVWGVLHHPPLPVPPLLWSRPGQRQRVQRGVSKDTQTPPSHPNQPVAGLDCFRPPPALHRPPCDAFGSPMVAASSPCSLSPPRALAPVPSLLLGLER